MIEKKVDPKCLHNLYVNVIHKDNVNRLIDFVFLKEFKMKNLNSNQIEQVSGGFELILIGCDYPKPPVVKMPAPILRPAPKKDIPIIIIDDPVPPCPVFR